MVDWIVFQKYSLLLLEEDYTFLLMTAGLALQLSLVNEMWTESMGVTPEQKLLESAHDLLCSLSPVSQMEAALSAWVLEWRGHGAEPPLSCAGHGAQGRIRALLKATEILALLIYTNWYIMFLPQQHGDFQSR